MGDDDKKLGVNIHQLEKQGIVDSDFDDVGAWLSNAEGIKMLWLLLEERIVLSIKLSESMFES